MFLFTRYRLHSSLLTSNLHTTVLHSTDSTMMIRSMLSSSRRLAAAGARSAGSAAPAAVQMLGGPGIPSSDVQAGLRKQPQEVMYGAVNEVARVRDPVVPTPTQIDEALSHRTTLQEVRRLQLLRSVVEARMEQQQRAEMATAPPVIDWSTHEVLHAPESAGLLPAPPSASGSGSGVGGEAAAEGEGDPGFADDDRSGSIA